METGGAESPVFMMDPAFGYEPHKDHVWSYDFVHERHDGRAFRLLTLLDEYTRECLAIEVQRQMNRTCWIRRSCSWIGECLNTFGPITGQSLRLRFGTG